MWIYWFMNDKKWFFTIFPQKKDCPKITPQTALNHLIITLDNDNS